MDFLSIRRTLKNKNFPSSPKRRVWDVARRLALAEALEERQLCWVNLGFTTSPVTTPTTPVAPGTSMTVNISFAGSGFTDPKPTGTITFFQDGIKDSSPVTLGGPGLITATASTSLTLNPPPAGAGDESVLSFSYSGDSYFGPDPDVESTVIYVTPATHTRPSVTPPADQTAVKGVAQAISLGSFSDPDSGPWSVTVNWGDNSANTTFTTSKTGDLGTLNHTYGATGSYPVIVTVTNSANQSDSGAFQVDTDTVHTKPTVAPPGNQTADTGVAQAIALGSFSDPDSGPWSVTVKWGDKSANTTFTTSKTGSLGTLLHTYSATGNYAVTVTVTNSANQSDSANFQVDASAAVHTAPTVTAPGDQAAVEGVAQAITLGSFDDPDSGPWSVTVTWGDKSANTTFTTSKTGDLGALVHTYGAVEKYAVTVTVTNSANQSDSAVFEVDATAPGHTKPTVTAPNNQTAFKGVAQTFALGSFSDPNSGPWTVVVSWGDGSATTGFTTATPGLLTQTHSFAALGTLTVTVTVTNSAKQAASASFHVAVSVGNPAPMVLGVGPEWGPTGGGTKVTIKGNNLGTASTAKVYFGSTQATIQSDNGSTIVALSPPGSDGTVDVRVTTASGTSAIAVYDEFIYALEPHGTSSVGYTFIDPLTGKKAVQWMDPPIAVGYDYQVTSGPNFSAVELPVGYTTTGYKLYLSNGKGGFATTAYATVAGGVLFNLPTGVKAFRVLGISTTANLSPTNPLAFVTGLEFASQTPVTVTMNPIATPALTGSATSPTVVQLNFTAVAGATGYLVQREVNGQWESFYFGSSTTLASKYTSCTITGLTPGSSLNFRVGTITPQETIYSNTITITQPALLSGSATSSTTAQLNFTAVAGATGYLVQWEFDGLWQSLVFGSSTTLAPKYTSCTVSGLTPGGSLNFRVGAITPQGTIYSNTLTITQPK